MGNTRFGLSALVDADNLTVIIDRGGHSFMTDASLSAWAHLLTEAFFLKARLTYQGASVQPLPLHLQLQLRT